jgi:hypothetical protein
LLLLPRRKKRGIPAQKSMSDPQISPEVMEMNPVRALRLMRNWRGMRRNI